MDIDLEGQRETGNVVLDLYLLLVRACLVVVVLFCF